MESEFLNQIKCHSSVIAYSTENKIIICLYYRELSDEVALVKSHLKRIAITSNNRKDKVFLGIDMDRLGYISKENLREMCHRQNLPSDDTLVTAVSTTL